MGFWIPKYTINAGLLAGRETPANGSLQGLYDFPSVSRNSSSNTRVAQRNDFANDSWDGAYGTSCLDDLINHAIAAYESGNLGQWYLLAEIEVPNPPDAQYYKQSYVIEAMDSGGRYRENTVTSGGITYYCKWFEASFMFRVSRYQYDTPYSAYTRTDLSANFTRGFGSGCKIITSTPDGVYYAFTGGWIWDRVLLSLGSFISTDNKECFGVAMYGERHMPPTSRVPQPNPDDRKSFSVIGQTMNWLNTLYGEFDIEEITDPNIDPNPPGPGPNPPPEPGPHIHEYDPIPIPPDPTVTATGAGFTTLYVPTAAILRLLASELFSDNVIQILQNFFTDIQDMIAGLSIVPFAVPLGPRCHHRIGLFESDINMNTAASQFVTVDCGSIDIQPYYNNFIDHAPYTKILLWLPYIGYQQINPDEVMGKGVHIVYKCDILSGSCVAFVLTGTSGGTEENVERVIAQFSGNCLVQIPTAAAAYNEMVASAINILTSAAGAAIEAGAAGAGAAAQTGGGTDSGQPLGSVEAYEMPVANEGDGGLAGQAASLIASMKPSVVRNGTPGSTSGYMGVQKPYMIRFIPREAIPDNFINIKGYSSNFGGTLSQLTGYCEVDDIQLNDVPATIPEISEIYKLLKGGVIL